MRARDLLLGVALCSGLPGCQACTGSTVPPATGTTSIPAAPAASRATPDATGAATTTSSSASPSRTASDLARLLPGAAAYVAIRPRAYRDAAVKPKSPWFSNLDEFGLWRSSEALDTLEEEAGIDARGALLIAVTGASERSARAVLDGLAAGLSESAFAALREAHGGDATRTRVLFPLLAGSDPGGAATALARHFITSAGAIEACPGGPSCAALGANQPLVLSRDPARAAAFYLDGTDLRVDVVVPLFVPGTHADALTALWEMQQQRGGAPDRCAQFRPDEVASLCLDAPAMGEVATTLEYATIVRELTDSPVDSDGKPLTPVERNRLAAHRRDLAALSLVLASPSRPMGGDGTLVVGRKGNRSTAWMTWALTDAVRPALEKAFATERCVVGDGVVNELFPAIRAAVGDPGKDFANPTELLIMAFGSEGSGLYVALAGSWFNVLGLADGAFSLMVKGVARAPQGMSYCMVTEAGRLSMEWRPVP